MLAAVAALFTDSLALCFLSLFALGAQATFSSPVRYALLPQHLAPGSPLPTLPAGDALAVDAQGTGNALLAHSGGHPDRPRPLWSSLPAQAGLVVFERDAGGLLTAARYYDDVEAPVGR